MKKILYSALTLILGLVLSSSGCNTMDTPDSDTYDKGVEIGGVIWATRNVAEPGKFAKNENDAGMFYQFDRRTGWSATNPLTSIPPFTTWDGSTPTSTTWTTANDPCPTGWHVPTKAQFDALIAIGSSLWEPCFGVNGRRYGTIDNFIFLPAAGWRSSSEGGKLYYDSDGTYGGCYHTSEQYNNEAANIVCFSSLSDGSGTKALKAGGHSIRCVKK